MAKKDPQIIKKRPGNGGVDAFGLYVDVVIFQKVSGTMIRQERFFVADKTVCRYSRTKGNKRAAWRSKTYSTAAEARSWLTSYCASLEASTGYGVALQHRPLVVELTATDVESLNAGEPPYARFAGTVATEKTVGKIDDDTWVAS